MSHDTIQETCNVYITARDRATGAVIAERVGHNVWTNVGREYSCLIKTYKSDALTAYREDRIAYMGVGTGTQPETVSVSALTTPVPYRGAQFLKKITHTLTTFPTIDASRTSVRYVCTFAEDELVPPDVGGDVYYITECGLFTDGKQGTFERGGREVGLAQASSQAPVAYHTFDPIPKLSTLELEIIWELRH